MLYFCTNTRRLCWKLLLDLSPLAFAKDRKFVRQYGTNKKLWKCTNISSIMIHNLTSILSRLQNILQYWDLK